MSSNGTVFVTGATEGIGRAIAFALARAGYDVGVCARHEPTVELLITELRALGVSAAGTAADVGSERAVQQAVRHVVEVLGPIDILVNNAGVGIIKRIEDLTSDEWDATMATNVRSLFLTTRQVLPEMRRRRSGTIVNIASLAGRNGFVGGTAYAASKHAVLGFSRSLLLEVRQDNIRVIAVCPGSVDTALLQDQPLLVPDVDKILQPEDVAHAVLQAITLPGRALVSELDIRPTNP
jgi:3-oxoacyl-[acyl-carrier protein] reductase